MTNLQIMKTTMVMVVAMVMAACGVDDSATKREEPTCKEIGCNFYDCTDFQATNECACDLFVDGKPEQVMCLRTDEPIL